jgi:hypothetical protein
MRAKARIDCGWSLRSVRDSSVCVHAARFEDTRHREQPQHALERRRIGTGGARQCLGCHRCIAEMVGDAELGHYMKAARQEVAGDQLPKLCGGRHGHEALLGGCNEPHCRAGGSRGAIPTLSFRP